MFRIKICGITNVGDALAVSQAGGDAIGLNFFSASPRACPLAIAAEITSRVPRELRKVGVFVNAPADEVRGVFDTLGLDLVQLHGDEPPEMLRHLRGVPVMRAFRPGSDLKVVGDYLRACHRLACMPRMVLIDGRAAGGGAYGGTGTQADWQAICESRTELLGEPLVLAGGLTPANVAGAIATVRPWAVDVATGVEESPGKKSAALVRAFVETARAAFADCEPAA